MKVLVIGDSCIDKFIYSTIDRICPEAPVPIVKPLYEHNNDGMSLNVVNNLKKLGVFVDCITNENIIEKIRYVDQRSGQIVIRIDLNDFCNKISHQQIDTIKDEYDALIISDYCKGFLDEDSIYKLSNHVTCPVFLDTKKKLGKWIENINFIKINEFEYNKNYEIIDNNLEILNKLIITKGSNGCIHKNSIFTVPAVPVKDVSGAGDTFLSGLVYNYIQTYNIETAIKFANKCATLVVQKHGVSTVTLNEIIE
jgi:bifunctional ADP-heptose synthase (sugar kinase/adenylyltransferase)